MALLRVGIAAVALLVAAFLPGGAARGEPDGDGGGDAGGEPGGEQAVGRVAAVDVDPGGRIRLALEAVYEALDEGRDGDARAALVRLREEYADALVPVPDDVAGPAPLHWPAARVVEVLLGRLSEEEQDRARGRWRAVARALFTRARAGDEEALKTLAREWAATPEGATALRALARRDLEEGRFASAASRLERWLLAHPGAGIDERATAVLALVDARGWLGDEGGLSGIPERFPQEVLRAVETARGRTTARLRTRQHQARLRASRRGMRGGLPRGPVLPKDPVVLWTRTYDRRGVVTGPHGSPYPSRIAATVAGDEEGAFLHEGRFVRRLDPWSGKEIWRFPGSSPHVWEFDTRAIYEEPALPLRTLSLTEDHVVTVLGTPVASGSFAVHGAEFQAADEPREARARLVVLQRKTGALVWTTGTGNDSHPVLGDSATSCASPPLVAGDAVYAIFARRRGATEFHLACLDLETGAPRWVTYLATGESGRESEVSNAGARFVQGRVRAPPWGAPPAVSDGEICVLPHAGFAAGVDAQSGRLTWLRALPRYQGNFEVGASKGFSGRDPPVSHVGLWILAPFDCPFLVAIEARTGRWRWRTPTNPGVEGPPWHHLHGVRDAPRGGPWLGLEGVGPVLIPLRRPTEPRVAPNAIAVDPSPMALLPRLGRAWDAGSHLVWIQLAGGQELFGGDDFDQAALYAAPWDGGPTDSVSIEGDGVPLAGDVHKLGSVWIVVGAYGAAGIAGREVGRRRPEPALRARLALDANLAARALAHAITPDEQAACLDAARACLLHDPSGIGALGDALLDVGSEAAHRVLLEALTAVGTTRRGSGSLPVELLDRLIAAGGDHLVRPEPGLELRIDLRAGALLEEWREKATYYPALRRREAQHERHVRVAAEASEAELREAIRRAIGTPAAAEGRKILRDRLAAAGRVAEAAAMAADLRLDLPADLRASPAKQRAFAAEQQAAEAAWRAEAGDVEGARSLLSDLLRWAGAVGPHPPAALARASALAADLAERHAWRPESPARYRRAFSLWGAGVPEPDSAEVRSVVVPEWVGPGADRPLDRFLVSRGLGLEIWSRSETRQIAAFPDAGEGWFGGTLQEVARWVPGGGVLVSSLVARQPADAAGLQAGDWILTWDDEPVPSASEFMHRIASAEPGLPVEVAVLRGGRSVLQRFTPGRRPVRDGRVVERERLWIDARGRVLVPGRVDLAWVDLETSARVPLWTWREQGVIRSVIVSGGQALVTVRRIREADVIVSVDLDAGTERWRRRIDGSVTTVDPTGSAVVVNAVWPARTSVLDAYDGTVRARAVVLQRRTRPRSRCWIPAPVSVNVHGRLWWIAGEEPTRELRSLNTTTGRVEWEEARGDLYAHEPLLAADGVVVVATGGESFEILAPDAVHGGVTWRYLREPPGEGEPTVLSLDADSRLFLAGRTLWVAALNGMGGWTVEVYEIDPAAPEPLRRRPDVNIGPSQYGRPYFVDARATPEGLRIGTATTSDRLLRRAEWVGADGSHLVWNDPDAGGRGVVQIRRHSPARVGDHLAVPTDQGVLFVPIEGNAAR